MSVKLLTEYDLEFLSLTGRCTGSSESTLVKNTLLEITEQNRAEILLDVNYTVSSLSYCFNN